LFVFRQDKNPLGFVNWQREENENLFLFSTSEPIRADSYPPILPEYEVNPA